MSQSTKGITLITLGDINEASTQAYKSVTTIAVSWKGVLVTFESKGTD